MLQLIVEEELDSILPRGTVTFSHNNGSYATTINLVLVSLDRAEKERSRLQGSTSIDPSSSNRLPLTNSMLEGYLLEGVYRQPRERIEG
jgi:hypothetical protein